MLKQVIEIVEMLDSAHVTGQQVLRLMHERGLAAEHGHCEKVDGREGSTDFVRFTIPGSRGKLLGGSAPTLGVIGRLGGIGARPERIGLVSDADGAVAALAVALKLIEMQQKGDVLPGDVIVSTHIAPHAPTKPHQPVPFMGSPVDMEAMNRCEVSEAMEAILTVDTTKGNRIFNQRGFAITPTLKSGWLLRISEDLVSLMEYATGKRAQVLPLSMQDITPYGNDIYHLNSIMQPGVMTDAPVVGVALTAETAVPGCATGASHEVDIEMAARFCIEVAKAYGEGQCSFFDSQEFARLEQLYGSMRHLLTKGQA